MNRERASIFKILAILCAAIILSSFTVSIQVRELGFDYLERQQVTRHIEVLNGAAGNPWQYRILSEYLVEGLIRAAINLGIQHPFAVAFIAFRVFQNILIFVLAGLYYRKFGLNTYITLFGLSFLAWAMTHSLYDSDLQFNTYSDIIFYLTAALLILHGKDIWIIPVTLFAALNRETSALIPLMLLADRIKFEPRKGISHQTVIIVVVSVAIYIFVFLGLRNLYGHQQMVIAYGNQPGLELLRYNVGRSLTWIQLLVTMSILPFMAIYSYRFWPDTLKRFCLIIVPLWFTVHFFCAVMAETRLVLVPYSVIIIPGALFGVTDRK